MTRTLQYIIALAIVLLGVQISVSAQYRNPTPKELVAKDSRRFIYEGKYRFAPAQFKHCNISKAEKIDESMLRVAYDAVVIVDTSSSVRYKDRMITLVGQTWYKSYGEGIWKGNMSYSLPIGDPKEKLYRKENGYEEIFNIAVYRNIRDHVIINRGQLPEMKEVVFRYDEQHAVFRWLISDETKEIRGYVCQKATTDYAGRNWTVWFTQEIPVDCGLWKFSGLPGLILEAYDGKREYVFTISSIEQKEEPIYIYRTPEKRLSRESYRKLEKNLYEDPILYSDGADGYRMWISKERGLTGREVFTSGHFMYPYNPMELK